MENVAQERNSRKLIIGKVVSSKPDKTIVVSVERRKKHPIYDKVLKKSGKFMAHDEKNECNPGDIVELMETRPLSKMKRWRLVKIVERAK
jgi:small subunit ribosomal protein S17